ncbi:MAG: ABC transporter permease [Treponema sp.]|jgi:ribose/xylose/arabinose/galactoside ABC-type transport system permease subunit|nr:ABC transporter permease [Treponema sp.]
MKDTLLKTIKHKKQEIILVVVIILISLIFQSLNSVFLSWGNITSVFSNYAVYGIMSLGMMLVISTGNIDVSVGGVLALISMSISSLVLSERINNPVTAILISLAFGVVLGLINGLLVAKLKLPAIIVTLGTLNIMRGTLLLGIGSQWKSGLPAWFTAIARTIPFGIGFKITAYIWVLMCFLTWFFMHYTIWGRRIIAAGSNAEASVRIGFNPAVAYILAFSVMGFMIGLGSLFYTANIGIAQPLAGMGYEMILISAAVIGGTSFSGGHISILGTFLGVLLLGIVENGMIISKIPVYWQEMMRGIVIIAAIVFLTIKVVRKKSVTLSGEKST